ncbi:protein eyes shut [Toxorhynchites rutilus septentrionalis]|uniref:protein eyes shut n=1 Tax=Toxorhynchites rutilus septentrionalis TaxID=329112 RepID=UPI002479B006|nr:protein eyes shut [Toxorhynchites rutilus septentrionalis]
MEMCNLIVKKCPTNYRTKFSCQWIWNNSATRIRTNWFLLVFGVASLSILAQTDAGFACLSNPCVYGVCIDDLNSTYSCYCIDGYTGVHCQTNWDECWSNPCRNGGTCVDGIASYNCTCRDGFIGLSCEENFNECLSNPCQNGGSCHDQDNSFVCSCAPGYVGVFCEEDVAVCDSGDRCHNGGECFEGPGLEFFCQCMEGYEGKFCDRETNECESSPCQNGAICIDKFASYDCACTLGFTGTNCEEEIMLCENSPCANQALCLMEENEPICYCVPDFHGERCEYQYDECQLEPNPRCVNGGTCVDGVDEYFCSCPPIFTGTNCECLIMEDASMDCNYTAPEPTTLDYISTSSWFRTSASSEYFEEEFVSRTEMPAVYSTFSASTQQYGLSNNTYTFTGTKPYSTESVTIETSIGAEASTASIEPTVYQYPSPTSGAEEESTSKKYPETTVKTGDEPSKTAYTRAEPDATEEMDAETTSRTTGSTLLISEDQVTSRTIDGSGLSTVDMKESSIPSDEATIKTEETSSDIDKGYTKISTASSSELRPTESGLPNITDAPTFEPGKTPVTKPGIIDTTIAERTDQTPVIDATLSPFFTESPENTSVSAQTEGPTKFGSSPASPPFEITFSSPTVTPLATTVSAQTAKPTDAIITECDDTVCSNGGTCSMTPSGIRCHCDFRYIGTFCDVPVSIQNAAFSRDSFLRHIIYRKNESESSNMTLSQVLTINTRFKAKMTSREGLIMLMAAEGTDGSHYVALFLHKGLLQFQFSCGLQTMLLSEIEGPVNNGYEMNIKVELHFNDRYTHCNASLHVNETLAMSGEQPTWLMNQNSEYTRTIPIKHSWLHLGGRPIKTMYTLSHNISRYQGFTGCIYELEVNQKPMAIFDHAEDAYRIYECTSLACLSSPCKNGAICVEDEGFILEKSYKPDIQANWSCKCAFGYMGKTCERSICDNNPCKFGGTCVTFPESGYLCLCPYGKHGHFCEHDLDILQPSFFGSIKGLSSFVAYPVSFPLEDQFEFSFKIIPTTSSQISLLAFLGQQDHTERSDHFSVSFIQGFILVTWNLGSGPRRIFTQQPIHVQPARPTTINVGRNGRLAWLSIDGKVNISGNSPGSSSKLNVSPYLYIGGHEKGNFSDLPHDLPLHSGFQGCLFDIHIIAGPVHIPLQHIGGMRGRSVGQCGTKECHRHACQNNGACLQHGSTFTCICQEDWNGLLCSQKNNPCDESNKCTIDAGCFPQISGYECDCPFGKIGKRCESNLKYLSDVSFSGRRSYLALKWPISADYSYLENEVRYEKIIQPASLMSQNHSILLKSINELDKINDVLKISNNESAADYLFSHTLAPRSGNYRQLKIRYLSIELQVRPLSEKGLLMFVQTCDTNERRQGFISLSLQGGVIEYRVSSTQMQTSVVRSNHVLAIGEWHHIKIIKYGKRLTLWVEGRSTSIMGSARDEFISPTSRVFFGGLPDLSQLPFDAISGFPLPFRGCVRNVNLNGTRITLNDTSILESRNINDCDGTPCGGDLCAKGGLCWLDEYSQPHCKCPEYSKGLNCEIQESCEVIKCQNNGQCLKSGRCSCGIGWTGYYCEFPTTKFSALGFNDRSYILIPSQKIKMKDKRNGESGGTNPRMELQISFNISTLDDGVVFWTTDKNSRYFGVGVRDGFITIASNMVADGGNSTTIGNPWKTYVADGDWHNVRIETENELVHVLVDGTPLFSELKLISDTSNFEFQERYYSDESTYLGGFPDEDIGNRTNGKFSNSFVGCIQSVYLGNNPEELDYLAYEGANINECEV